MNTRDDERRVHIQPVVAWLKARQDGRAFDRVRLRMLSKTLKERISLDKVGEDTLVSEGYYQAFVEAAVEVTGEPFKAAPAVTRRSRSNDAN